MEFLKFKNFENLDLDRIFGEQVVMMPMFLLDWVLKVQGVDLAGVKNGSKNWVKNWAKIRSKIGQKQAKKQVKKWDQKSGQKIGQNHPVNIDFIRTSLNIRRYEEFIHDHMVVTGSQPGNQIGVSLKKSKNQ